MRNHIVELVRKAAQESPDVVFVTGDLGFSVVERIQAEIGDRFINAGIAEQNMVSMAASLAFCGFEPYVYTITPFITARCYEQVRNDVCYPGAGVRLIGNGAGFAYGTLGATHHALEDATIFGALPNMTVFSPASLSELDRLFELSRDIKGAVYYRIGREDGPAGDAPDFDLVNSVPTWMSGTQLNLVTSGSIANEVFHAADELKKAGIDVRLLTVPIVSPFPREAFLGSIADAPTVVVYEACTANPLESGIGASLIETGWRWPVRFLNAGNNFAKVVGTMDYQREIVGIDKASIVRVAMAVLEGAAA